MAGLINLRLLTDFFNKIDPKPTLRRPTAPPLYLDQGPLPQPRRGL